MSIGSVRAAALLPFLLGSLAPGCARDTGGAAIVRKSALGALPTETVGLLVLEVRALRALKRTSSWMEEMAAITDQEGPFREVRDRFGLETLKRLDRIGLAVVPGPDDRVAYGIVAEGSFDPAKIREALGGQDLVTLVEGEGRPDFSVAALTGGSFALGPRHVLEVIRANARRRGAGLDGNRPFLDLLLKVRPTSQVWGAVDCRALGRFARKSPLVQGIGGSVIVNSPQASSLVSIAFEGRIADKVEFDLLGRVDAEPHARTLAEAARGLIAIARMGAGAGQAGGWPEFLEGITLEQHGSAITLHGLVPEKAMAALAARAQAASERRREAPSGLGPAAPEGGGLQGSPAATPLTSAPAPTMPEPAPTEVAPGAAAPAPSASAPTPAAPAGSPAVAPKP